MCLHCFVNSCVENTRKSCSGVPGEKYCCHCKQRIFFKLLTQKKGSNERSRLFKNIKYYTDFSFKQLTLVVTTKNKMAYWLA